MSVPIAVNDVIQVRLEYSYGETVAYNLLDYQVASISGTMPSPAGVLGSLAEDFFNLYGPLWDDAASSAVKMTGVSVQDVWPEPRTNIIRYTPGTPRPGLVSGEPLPLQDAPCFTKRTDYGQRWGRGRFFYVGLAEEGQVGGIITNASMLLLEPLAALIAQGVVISGTGWGMNLKPVLYSKKKGVPPRITPITVCHAESNIIKSQKRRRPGKGI